MISIVLLSLIGCGSNSESELTEFIEGEVILSTLGESYTQFIDLGDSLNISDSTATISSHIIKATKKLNINDPNDYALGGSYWQYLYTATVVGKVDSKYSGKAIYVYTSYPISVLTVVVNGYKNGALIQPDGSFELTYLVYCNQLLKTFTPYRIDI